MAKVKLLGGPFNGQESDSRVPAEIYFSDRSKPNGEVHVYVTNEFVHFKETISRDEFLRRTGQEKEGGSTA